MSNLPAGTVTFLFTDIEGSARLIERHPEAMAEGLARHNAVLERAIGRNGGRVFKTVGDAFCAAFGDTGGAIRAALDAQRALHAADWGALGALRVRMGLHTGQAEPQDGEYPTSLALVRVQRVMAAGHGGQILLSADGAKAIGAALPDGTVLRRLGECKLRGLIETETLHQLVAPDLPSTFPAPRVLETAATLAVPLHELVRGQLVGRSAELAQLRRHWDQAQQARGHLVLVSGEPGVGKTRLAQDLIDCAQSGGATVLRGGCYEFEATTPYLPFVEAFRDWTRWQGIEQLRAQLGATAPEIAKFAPEIGARLGGLVPNAPLSPGEERLRLFDNAARFLGALAASRGLLLFVDDLHWADQGTLSLLHFLLRQLKDQRVLVLAAYREIELDRSHPLAAALVDWNRERLATRVALGRLSREDTAALLATLFAQASVSDDFAGALFRETEGNPFFVEEVVKSLIEQGEIYREGSVWNRKEAHELTIPQSVKEAIGRRLTRLAEPTIDALRIAAALGKVFSFRELAAVSAAQEDPLLDALDEASAAQLIRPAGSGPGAAPAAGDAFAFTHDKIREVLYEELNPIRRRRLHQRIGETLERIHGIAAGAPPDGAEAADPHVQDLAHHFAQAGDLERALAYLRRAAREAERVFAHDEALKFLEQARESAQALARQDAVAAIDEAIGDVHVTRGVVPDAVAAYERALEASADRDARAALKAKIGNAYVPVGDPRGLRRLEEALSELDPATQTNALALATALVGRYHHYRSELERSLAYLDRARALAEPLDDPQTLAQVYSFLCGTNQHLLRYADSDGWARKSIAMGERTRHVEAIAVGYEFLAENAFGRGCWDDCLAYGAQDRAHGERIGSLARVAWSEFCRVNGLFGKGELRAAREVADAALVLCERIGEERLATWLDPALGAILADLGDAAAARFHADRGWERACELDQVVLTAWALHGLGRVALQSGDLAAAAIHYQSYLALVRKSENQVARHVIATYAAEAFVLAGCMDEAEQAYAIGAETARIADAPHFQALAGCVRGQMHAARGDPAAALRGFDAALATFAATGSRLEWARALHHRAAVRFAAGESGTARDDAALALEAFAAMGALPDRARTEGLVARH